MTQPKWGINRSFWSFCFSFGSVRLVDKWIICWLVGEFVFTADTPTHLFILFLSLRSKTPGRYSQIHAGGMILLFFLTLRRFILIEQLDWMVQTSIPKTNLFFNLLFTCVCVDVIWLFEAIAQQDYHIQESIINESETLAFDNFVFRPPQD